MFNTLFLLLYLILRVCQNSFRIPFSSIFELTNWIRASQNLSYRNKGSHLSLKDFSCSFPTLKQKLGKTSPSLSFSKITNSIVSFIFISYFMGFEIKINKIRDNSTPSFAEIASEIIRLLF